MPRSPFLHGLSLTIRNPRPLVFTYFFNAAIAWVASWGLRTQFSEVTSTSLAAQRMIGGFDLGVVIDAGRRLNDGPHGMMVSSALAIPLYFLVFFLFVPGTLYAYQTDRFLGLSGIMQKGVQGIFSFGRIVLLTMVVAVPVLGLAAVMQAAWAHFLDQHMPGEQGFYLRMAGAFAVFLVACLLRLYFDLVEVHTVALGMTLRPNGKPDRRIRKTFRPALRSLGARFGTLYLLFVLLAVAGGVAVYFLGFSALRHLGQPRAWPTLLLAQLGLFLMLFTRFWQRAAETIVVQQVFPPQRRQQEFGPPTGVDRRASRAPEPLSDPILSDPIPPVDPIPPSEPIAPSLDEPDPGVFHHDVEPPSTT